MDILAAITTYARTAFDHVWFLLTSPSSFLSLEGMLGAVVIGTAIVFFRLRKAGIVPSPGNLLEALLPAHVRRHVSTRHDMAIIAINEGLLFFLGTVTSASLALVSILLLDLASSPEMFDNAHAYAWWEFAAFGLFYVLVWDFAVSFNHFLKHKIPVLWEIHKVHHCAEVMTPLTALRRHPVEIFVNNIVIGAITMLAVFTWAMVMGAPGESWKIAGVFAGIYVYRILGYNLRHTHLHVSYGRFWNRILVSPAHHQLHHSDDPAHYDCNFGLIFTFWDRMFGTLRHPEPGQQITYGIAPEDQAELRTLGDLYWRPLVNAWRRMTSARPKAAVDPASVPAE